MTIEAVLLTPMLLSVTFAVLLLAFYVYSRALSTAVCGEAVIAASTEGVRESGDAEQLLEDREEEGLEAAVLPLASLSSDTDAEDAKVSMEVTIKSLTVFGIGGWETTVSEETSIVRPVTAIRAVQTGDAWANRLKEIWKG